MQQTGHDTDEDNSRERQPIVSHHIQQDDSEQKQKQQPHPLPSSSSPPPPPLTNIIRQGHAMVTLTIVGVLIGGLASVMECATHWLADLRLGYCSYNLFLPEYVCCRQAALGVSSDGVSSSSSSSSASFVFSSSSDVSFSLTRCPDFVRWASSSPLSSVLVYVALTVAFAVTAAMICAVHHPRSTTGSGVPEVKKVLAGGRVLDSFLSFPVILAKSCSLCLAVGSGLFVGKEAPLVHLGCAVACTVRRALRQIAFRHQSSFGALWGDTDVSDDIDLDPPDVSSPQSNELLCAAAAAGVGAGFAAPLGGVMLVVEELSYRFPRRTMIRSFLCAIVATLTLRVIDATYTGRALQFSVDATSASWRWSELVFVFPLLGVLCGLVGGLCIKLMLFVKQTKRTLLPWLADRPLLEVGVIACATGVVNYFVPNLDRGAFEVLHDIFLPTAREDETHWGNIFALVSAGAFRVAAFGVMFSGVHVPAGSLVPSLFVGACFGRSVGLVVQRLVADINNGNSGGRSGFFFRTLLSCASTASAAESAVSFGGTVASVDASVSSDLGSSSSFSSTTAATTAAGSASCLVSPGLYAALGSAACLAGVTKLTMCLVLIIVEMTNAPGYTLPLVCVSLVAKRTTEWLEIPGIYDHQQQDKNNSSAPPPAAATASVTSNVDGGDGSDHDHDHDDDDVELGARRRQKIITHPSTTTSIRDLLPHICPIELPATGMTLKGVRDVINTAFSKTLSLSSSETKSATTATTVVKIVPVSRLQPVLVLQHDVVEEEERSAGRRHLHPHHRSPPRLLLGVTRVGTVVDELAVGACAASHCPDDDLVAFSTSSSPASPRHHQHSGRASSTAAAAAAVWNWFHLLEETFLVVRPGSSVAALVERLRHDMDTTTSIVVMDDRGSPMGCFSRQQVMELFEEG